MFSRKSLKKKVIKKKGAFKLHSFSSSKLMDPDHAELGIKKNSNLISTITTTNPNKADGTLSWS